jgi:sodium transport system permease protein
VSPVRIVFFKELVDGLRDRRSLVSLLLFPLVGPLLISFILTQTTDQMAPDEEMRLPVVGRDNAPGLVTFLDDRGIEIVEAPADPLAAVSAREAEVVLIIPDDYGERFRSGRPATVEIVSDEYRSDGRGATARRVRRLVRGYGAQIGTLRLLARGVSPDLAQPVTVQEIDVSTPKSRAALFLNFIPMFVLLAAFIGGMFSATDSTAGERERGSLEPLLLNPVTRRSIVIGKWLATVVFSSFTVVSTLCFTLLALGRVSVKEMGISSLSLTPGEAVSVLLATLPLCLLASAAQLLTASFARSFREAQTYLSLMVFVPTIPAALVTVMPLKSQIWMMAIPVFGQQVLLMDVIRGEPISAAWVALAALVALLGAGLCLQATASLFRRETIVYGR